MLWFRRQFSQPHLRQKQAASHFYQTQQKDVKIKSALVITIKVKKIIAPKIPGNIKPTIPAELRMHAWLRKSRTRCKRKIRESLWRFNTTASRCGDNVVVLDCWIPLLLLVTFWLKVTKLTSSIWLNSDWHWQELSILKFFLLSAWQEALRGTDIFSSEQKI